MLYVIMHVFDILGNEDESMSPCMYLGVVIPQHWRTGIL